MASARSSAQRREYMAKRNARLGRRRASKVGAQSVAQRRRSWDGYVLRLPHFGERLATSSKTVCELMIPAKKIKKAKKRARRQRQVYRKIKMRG